MLFARCSHCQTVFQVTPAQLEVARGFVRCGRCQKPFYAIDHLTDEQGQPVEQIQPQTEQEPEQEKASPSGFIHLSGDAPDMERDPESEKAPAKPVVVEIIGSLAHFSKIEPYYTPEPLSTQKKRPTPSASKKAQDRADQSADSSKATPSDAPSDDPSLKKESIAASAPDEEEIAAEIPTLFLAATLDELAMIQKSSKGSGRTLQYSMDALIYWALANCFLILLLVAQIAFMTRHHAVYFLPFRPPLELICRQIGCLLPPRRDLGAFAILDRSVTVHPDTPDALLVELIFTNEASYRQPLPLVEFSLLDPNSEPTFWRQFPPTLYLVDDLDQSVWIQPNQPVLLQLEIIHPGEEIENYSFRFL